jgi:hypothetical protein
MKRKRQLDVKLLPKLSNPQQNHNNSIVAACMNNSTKLFAITDLKYVHSGFFNRMLSIIAFTAIISHPNWASCGGSAIYYSR